MRLKLTARCVRKNRVLRRMPWKLPLRHAAHEHDRQLPAARLGDGPLQQRRPDTAPTMALRHPYRLDLRPRVGQVGERPLVERAHGHDLLREDIERLRDWARTRTRAALHQSEEHLRDAQRTEALLAELTGATGREFEARFAHGGDETQEGYLLVQQALGHLAHDTSSEGIDLAMEKVGDALEAEDQEGVDIPELEDGMRALEEGQVEQARALLQDSIDEAVSGLPAATGYETGTSVVTSSLPGRTGLSGQDLGLLAGSFAVAGLGLVLAYRFRPRDSVRALRGRLRAEGHP